ncbi:hypothetical protein HDU98_011829 [Podochytrium sp. JEL0797]|nr:hypothetical protein HDU98_011829 [Podochytrium sp. JEL0797]
MVGVGKANIALPIGDINMQGYADLAQSANGIHMRLKARAFVFTNPESPLQRVVYVSSDLGWMSSIARQEVIERLNVARYQDPISKQPLYTLDNVMTSVTHTHSSPGGHADDFMYQITSLGRVPMAREAVVEGVLAAIQAAHSDLEAALISVAERKETQTVVVNAGVLANAGINRSPSSYLENPADERARYDSDVDQTMVGVSVWTNSSNGKRGERRLKGHANWFAVHGTSLHSTNMLVSGDNKGFASYLWELEERGKKSGGDFVAAFAQSNSGDVSPNLVAPRCIDTGESCDGSKGSCNGDVTKCLGLGPGEEKGNDHFYSAEYIGRLQYEQAKRITDFERGVVVKGPIEFRHAWVDMSDVDVELPGGSRAKTCTPAMGYSFVAGTTDGKGLMFSYQGYNKRDDNLVLTFVKGLLNFHAISPDLERCHSPKVILLNTGDNHIPYAWQPRVLPLQMFLVGRKLVLVGQPSEMTTMAGRRLRETVKQSLLSDKKIDPDAQVVIVGLANAYSSYVTTKEEYNAQRYEGASTAYGPNTLLAYEKLFTRMARSFANPQESLTAGSPPKKPKNEMSLTIPIVLDTVRPGSEFGHVITQPSKLQYSLVPHRFVGAGSLGDGHVSRRIKNVTTTVEASFMCAHPRNGAGHQSTRTNEETYMVVEKQDERNPDVWNEFLTDEEWDTKYHWRRSGITESICTLAWDIGRTVLVPSGRFRFRIFGVAKLLFGEKSFTGVSEAFSLVEEQEGIVLQQ